jgi:hypothetical protein
MARRRRPSSIIPLTIGQIALSPSVAVCDMPWNPVVNNVSVRNGQSPSITRLGRIVRMDGDATGDGSGLTMP